MAAISHYRGHVTAGDMEELREENRLGVFRMTALDLPHLAENIHFELFGNELTFGWFAYGIRYAKDEEQARSKFRGWVLELHGCFRKGGNREIWVTGKGRFSLPVGR